MADEMIHEIRERLAEGYGAETFEAQLLALADEYEDNGARDGRGLLGCPTEGSS